MFKLFGFLEMVSGGGKTSSHGPEQPAAYAEALLAGWVPPLPEVEARSGPIQRTIEEKSDSAAFLARVYRNQQC